MRRALLPVLLPVLLAPCGAVAVPLSTTTLAAAYGLPPYVPVADLGHLYTAWPRAAYDAAYDAPDDNISDDAYPVAPGHRRYLHDQGHEERGTAEDEACTDPASEEEPGEEPEEKQDAASLHLNTNDAHLWA